MRSKQNSAAVESSASSISASPRRPEEVNCCIATRHPAALSPIPAPPSDRPQASTTAASATAAAADTARTLHGPVSLESSATTEPAQ